MSIIKKIQNTLLLTLFVTMNLSAQVITTNPELPLPNESLSITFHADQGNAALEDYTDEIYAHTGVITSESASESDWRYVKTDWDENTEANQLTHLSGNDWQLDITPSIREYYGVPQDETILQVAFVFRNSDGSIVGREADGGDIFADVFSDSTAVLWNNPDTTKVYSIGDMIDIDASILAAESLELKVNGTTVATSDNNTISHTYEATQSGDIEIQLNVTTAATLFSENISIFVASGTQTEPLPSENLKDGINYIDDNTVTLVLYAPDKNFVVAKGSFNNWAISSANQMYRTPDGGRYWLTIDNLTPGQEYAFQYIVDGDITIADPYADKVLDPWNDQYISEDTYPGLMPYPTGNAEGIVSVFQTAQEPYNWQSDNFEKPDNENLIIYEMLLRDFIENHDFQTLADTIQYFKNLGVNAIELMPVNEFEGNSSWGYNPSFYFAPDKYYGPKNDLKAFIDLCHQNDIAVILDMVLNHSYGQSPLVQLYFDPAAGDYGQPTPENPWYNETSPNATYSWGFDFDHESEQTQKFVNRVTKYWLTEYKFDGYRFDFTKGFTNTPGDGWSYDQDRIDILKRIADTIWNTNNDAYIILEHFAENSEEKILAEYGMMLWGNLNHAYNQSSMGYTNESDFSWISYQERDWSVPHVVGYMESHDEERQLYKNITWGNNNATYDITQKDIALRRAELTSLFFLTIPGPKMIWQFGELGYDYSINYDCRVCEKPIRWDYFEEDGRRHLYHFYKQVTDLREINPIFQSDDFSINADSKIKTITFEKNNQKAILIGNFGINTRTYTPDLSGYSGWYSYFDGNTTLSGDTTFSIAPGHYKLLTTESAEAPAWPEFPEARNVYITGDTALGSTLTVHYDYFDLNDDAEGTTQFQWYISDDASGQNKRPIPGATSQELVLTKEAEQQYLSAVVKPVAQGDEYTTGLPVESELFGPATTTLSVQTQDEKAPTVFPNPITDYHGEITISNTNNYHTIQVINAAGRVLRNIPVQGNTIDIDFSGFQNGFYYITLKGANQTASKKIIKTP